MIGRQNHKTLAILSIIMEASMIICLKLITNACGGLFCWSFVPAYTFVAVLLVLRVILWNMALSRSNLSDIYIFTALTPVLLLIFSVSLLNEKISVVSLIGASIIIIGIYLQIKSKQPSP